MTEAERDPFSHRGWTLHDAIDALMAYDHGATDSGVSDDDLRAAVADHFTRMDDKAYRRAVAGIARSMLSDERIGAGYGLADVVGFAEWLEGVGR